MLYKKKQYEIDIEWIISLDIQFINIFMLIISYYYLTFDI